MTGSKDWIGRAGDSWAEEWRRTDRSFGALTEALISKARERRFHCVLDLGCGAGELSLALARGQGGAEIRGIDISQPLVEMARSRSKNLSNIAFETADIASWSSDEFRADLLISRHGLMFFDDPMTTFAHLRRIGEPDARLIFSAFRDREENPWASCVAELLPSSHQTGEAGASADVSLEPGPFAFADRNRVTRLLQDAGWRDIEVAPFDYAYVAGMGEAPVDDALSFFQKIGPAAAACAELSDADRTLFGNRLQRFLAQHERKGVVALKASAWIVTANAGDATVR